MTEHVTRFAPSPTGFLHLGHAHAALFAASAGGGRFLLRIEDIDRGRCRPEFEAAIFEDLAWLGLAWDDPVLRQSERGDAYRDALDRLNALGVLYPCFCTRKEIAAEIARAGAAPHGGLERGSESGEGPRYPGICRELGRAERAARLEHGDGFALRIDAARAAALAGPLTFSDRHFGDLRADPEILGDAVLARRDIGTSYHLAVVVDDALQGVSLVTRGADLLPSTHLHRLLQALLDLPVPEYHHHRLIGDATGARLAKRDDAHSIRALREAGWKPAAVRAQAGFPD
ncbi:MAG: tRNA glutamyl-Q(34) synthetase GluQRS [Alphaproteobacteria bacterium]|nr:tRNA glutamyl-Q(34) synthetase GluQRS [Alphaproteobacteria bacterium]